VPPFQAREALMRDFHSQEGCSKPILRMKITPEGLSILEWGHRNDISRVKRLFYHNFFLTEVDRQDAAENHAEDPCGV
jgi:hypothetical protein